MDSLEARRLRRRRQLQEQESLQENRIAVLEQGVSDIERTMVRRASEAVLFLNITSGLRHPGFHGLAGLMMSWSLRIAGHRVVHLVCRKGLPRCPQGIDLENLTAAPPCDQCFGHRSRMFASDLTQYIDPDPDRVAAVAALAKRSLLHLMDYTYDGINFGQLCLPTVRWSLRRHTLVDDPPTCRVYAEQVISAMAVRDAVEALLAHTPVRRAVIFNGTFFPEAVARYALQRHNVPVVTYEAGFKAESLFLSHDVATLYRLGIPASFTMGERENEELNRYMTQRMAGQFTMSGIQFWPEMKSMSPALLERCRAFGRVVTVFTNVCFDTSQTYAHLAFKGMFEWLNDTLELASGHGDTLFIIRAHPDEARRGRESRESLESFMNGRRAEALSNVVFIGSSEYVSSYELLKSSRFCMVYNGTIGIEATVMAVPVVAGGVTRYRDGGFTYQPDTREAHREIVLSLLTGAPPALSDEWVQRARRYMYYSVFRAGVDFSRYIERVMPSGRWIPRIASAADLHPARSAEFANIERGLETGCSFDYPAGG